MLTYFSVLFSGDSDALRISLLVGAVVGGLAVGIGIFWESHKLTLATALVLLGVVVEAICTIFLFVIDEGISRAQQSTIIALENRLAARSLSDVQAADITERLKSFSLLTFQIIPYWDDKESKDIADRIDLILEGVGWKLENPTRFTFIAGVIAGVVINIDSRASENARGAAKALAAALSDNGIAAIEREMADTTTTPPSERINLAYPVNADTHYM
jgi:hypothetical protein